MSFNDIYKALKPLRRKMHLNNTILCLVYAVVLAGAFSFILSFIALFLAIPYLGDRLLSIYGFFILAGALTSIFLRPGIQKTIKMGDSLGLKERLVTAYQLKDEDSALVKIQRQDALNAVSDTDFKSLYPVKFPYGQIIAAFVLLSMVLVTFIVPTGAKDRALTTENIIDETKKQAEKLDAKRKELGKNTRITNDKLKEVNKKIDELLKELNRSKNEEDALKALSKAKHELEKMKDPAMDKDLVKLSEKLVNNPLTKELGEALKEGKTEDIDKKLKELEEKLKGADDEYRKKLAEELKEALKEIKNKDLSQSLSDLSEALQTGDLSALNANIKTLSGTLANIVKANTEEINANEQPGNGDLGQMVQALNEARYQIFRASGRSSAFTPGSGQEGNGSGEGDDSGSQGDGQQGNDGSGASGDGQGADGSQGSGQGNQGGQGSGQNSLGQAGGGVGDGSSSQDAGYTGTESGGGVKKPGEKKVGDYEKIYVPDRLGGDSQASQVKGSKSNSGQSQWSEVQAPIGEGNARPYNEVLQEYTDEAMSGLKDAPIPPGMKDIVRDYFSTLE
ncbi:MAG: DUF4175 family protein [Bacillota bacterium]